MLAEASKDRIDGLAPITDKSSGSTRFALRFPPVAALRDVLGAAYVHARKEARASSGTTTAPVWRRSFLGGFAPWMHMAVPRPLH